MAVHGHWSRRFHLTPTVENLPIKPSLFRGAVDERRILRVVSVLALGLYARLAYGSVGIEFSLANGIRVNILEARFAKERFGIQGCDGNRPICLIDGRIPFGAGQRMPKTYVVSITVIYRGRSYALDTSDMYNAWAAWSTAAPGAVRSFDGRCSDAKDCQFRGLFSKGADAFVAEWRIVNGVSTRTVFTNHRDTMNQLVSQMELQRFK